MPFVNAVKDPPKERKNVRSWIASSGEIVFELKSVSTESLDKPKEEKFHRQ